MTPNGSTMAQFLSIVDSHCSNLNDNGRFRSMLMAILTCRNILHWWFFVTRQCNRLCALIQWWGRTRDDSCSDKEWSWWFLYSAAICLQSNVCQSSSRSVETALTFVFAMIRMGLSGMDEAEWGVVGSKRSLEPLVQSVKSVSNVDRLITAHHSSPYRSYEELSDPFEQRTHFGSFAPSPSRNKIRSERYKSCYYLPNDSRLIVLRHGRCVGLIITRFTSHRKSDWPLWVEIAHSKENFEPRIAIECTVNIWPVILFQVHRIVTSVLIDVFLFRDESDDYEFSDWR
jgi:hypothetical protein